ncbi:hypothetical protein AKJ56_01775 [candidate division MSBL1 archaeon SCGC-AAA382N08]|uniref:Transcription regulator PadR N-terminal domain-containing protein n=1 Tax=candidate division MSBL1 archaeon SCGC-AAA382N08 TaxID=1698285 RepID=A0A133VNZ1_9EURY|nr:hypothetical protein AKJ56_01775 [candidate division MSBL1 archaeon SCGC-AAA382N08]
MEKFKRRPVPDWVLKRVKDRLRHLRNSGFVEVVNAPPYKQGRIYIYRLTESGENYAEYHYETNYDDLKVSRRLL